jgi:hypothetical protein
MDLIEILQTNGTGLLSGTCRLMDPHFSSFEEFSNESSSEETILVSFSLFEKNLGIFKVVVDERTAINFRSGNGIRFSPEILKKMIVKLKDHPEIILEISWYPPEYSPAINIEFPSFKAIKQNLD